MGAACRTMMLPALALGMKSAASGLRPEVLLVGTGRWSDTVSTASSCSGPIGLLSLQLPAHAQGIKAVASGLRPEELLVW